MLIYFGGQKLHGCENCGTRFYNKVSLDEHVERCRELDAFKREELNLDDGEEMVQEVVEEEIIDTFHEQVRIVNYVSVLSVAIGKFGAPSC